MLFNLLALALAASAAVDKPHRKCRPELPEDAFVDETVTNDVSAAIMALLPEREPLAQDHPLVALDVTDRGVLVVDEDGMDMTVTFIHEGAGYESQLFYFLYTVEDDGSIVKGDDVLIFENVSYWRKGCMFTGVARTFSGFQRGDRIGFKLIADGYNRDSRAGPWHTIDSLNPEENGQIYRHTAVAQEDIDGLDADTTVIDLGFEDLLYQSGDKDFNDAVFRVRFVGEVELAPTTPVTRDGILVETSQCTDATEADITSTTQSFGYEYALLDGADVDGNGVGCQSTMRLIPDGWELAENTPTTTSALMCHTWSTTCVGLEDGTFVNPLTLAECEGFMLETDVAVDSDDDEPDCARATTCPARILIRRADPAVSAYLDEVDVALSFDETDEDTTRALGWTPEGAGYTIVSDGRTGNAIRIAGSGTALLEIAVPAESATLSLSVSVWSRVITQGSLSDTPSEAYSLFIDIFYTDGTADFRSVGYLDPTNTEWHQTTADILPAAGKTLETVRVRMRLTEEATVEFDDVTLGAASGNRLVNGALDLPAVDGAAFFWDEYRDGYTLDASVFGEECLLMSADGTDEEHGAVQVIDLTGSQLPESVTLLFGAESAAEGVSGTADINYGLWVDLFFEDAEPSYGNVVEFETGTHGFEQAFKTLSAGFKLERIVVTPLFRAHSGQACFKNIFVSVVADCAAPSATSLVHGDPHYVTFDGLRFDYQGVGEFLLVEDPSITVQVRHEAAGEAAIATAVSIGYNETFVSLEATSGTRNPVLRVNGGLVFLGTVHQTVLLNETAGSVGTALLSGTVGSEETPFTMDVVFPETGHRVTAVVFVSSFDVQFFQVSVSVPESSAGLTTGLLGNYNGDATDDLEVETARRRRQDETDAEFIHTVVGEAYRITNDSNSNFYYAAGDGPETFNDLSRGTPPGVEDFPAEDVATAEEVCSEYVGLDETTYTECLLDVLYTDDASFTVGYRSVQSVVGSDAAADDLAAVSVESGDDDDDSNGNGGGDGDDAAIIVGSILGATALIGFVVLVHQRMKLSSEDKQLNAASGETLATGEQLGARELQRRQETGI